MVFSGNIFFSFNFVNIKGCKQSEDYFKQVCSCEI